MEDNPEVGLCFVIAYFKGIQQYNQGKTTHNLDIIIKATDLERNFVEEACWPSLRLEGLIATSLLLDFQNWGVERGLLDTSVTEEQFWDSSLAEDANALLNRQEKMTIGLYGYTATY